MSHHPFDEEGGQATDLEQGTQRSLAMLGDGGGEDLPILNPVGVRSSGGSFLNRGSWLLLGVAVLSCAALYSMRRSQADIVADQSIKDVEIKIEQVLAKLASIEDDGGPTNQDGETIVAILAYDPTDQQIPIQFVKKNPFALARLNPMTEASNPKAKRIDPQEKRSQEKVLYEFNQLRLESVVSGPRPVAVISGSIVRKGDTVGSLTVTAIRKTAVDLEHEGKPYRLEIKASLEDSARSPRRRR